MSTYSGLTRDLFRKICIFSKATAYSNSDVKLGLETLAQMIIQEFFPMFSKNSTSASKCWLFYWIQVTHWSFTCPFPQSFYPISQGKGTQEERHVLGSRFPSTSHLPFPHLHHYWVLYSRGLSLLTF
jgi:hypothetical protein